MGRVAPSIHRDAERASVLGSSETGEQGKRARGAKCHKVQTSSVIGVIITLVTSCWTSAFRAPAPAVPRSQQLAAISPGLIIYPPPTRKAGILATPKKRPLFTELSRAKVFPETQRTRGPELLRTYLLFGGLEDLLP
jgi:hypothetical protein